MGLALELDSHNNVLLGEQVSTGPDTKQRIQGRLILKAHPKMDLTQKQKLQRRP